MILGVTGSIGAGKTTVSKRLADHGGALIEADKLGHAVLNDPEVHRRLVETFGREILDESHKISRRQLGNVVFADPEARRRLESVVHPLITQEMHQRITRIQSGNPGTFIVLDAALLLEAHWESNCDEILFVDASRATRERRVAQGRGWSPEELARREAAQWPVEKKRSRASYVFENDSSLTDLYHQVDAWFRERWKRELTNNPPPTRKNT